MAAAREGLFLTLGIEQVSVFVRKKAFTPHCVILNCLNILDLPCSGVARMASLNMLNGERRDFVQGFPRSGWLIQCIVCIHIILAIWIRKYFKEYHLV